MHGDNTIAQNAAITVMTLTVVTLTVVTLATIVIGASD